MPDTTININFPEYKLKAIKHALQEKQEPKTVETFLREHVDGLYLKNVPAQARKYLDSLLGDSQTAAPEQSAPTQEPESPTRRQYRRRENAAQQQDAAEPVASEQAGLEQEAEAEPEQTPGMTMSM